MNIENVKLEDIAEISKMTPENWWNIGPIFELYLKLNFCHPVKLTEDNEIIGIGTAILYKNSSWIAHLIVKNSYQNKGFGKKILDYLCEYCLNNGKKTILLFATEMGYPLYKKFGFEIQTEYMQYERVNDMEYIINNNVTNIQKIDYGKILELDKIVIGEDRSVLLNNYFDNGFVYKQNNEISGFYLPELGNGLIIADNNEAGLELLKLRLKNNNQAVIPVENMFGNNYYRENKYKEIMKIKRMIYGNKIECINEKIYNRIGGNFG